MIESTASAVEIIVTDKPVARMGRTLVLSVGAIAAAGIGAVWHPLSPLCVFVAGGMITLAVVGHHAFLRRVALTAYAAHALLAIGFHVLSGLDIGGLQALLTAPVGNYRFWIFSLDSRSYHAAAVKSVVAWQYGTEFPNATGPEYFIFTGLMYFAFGSNPLNVVLWNGLFGALSAVLGFRLATRVVGEERAKVAAVLIGFWPSALMWSTQLLKESICLFLTLAILYQTMRCVEDPWAPAGRVGRSGAAGLVRWVGRLIVLLLAAIVMYRFRNHVFLILIPAPAVFIVVGLARRSRGALWQGFAAAVVIALMIGASSAGRRIDLDAIFAPAHPEIGHVNRGVALQVARDLDAAEAEYRRALKIRPGYPPAIWNLASIAVTRRRSEPAIVLLAEYRKARPDERAVEAILGRLRQGIFVPLEPLEVPVEPKGLSLTGPHSDYTTGNRKYPVDDLVTAIALARLGYTSSGGYSMIDPDVKFENLWDIVRYLPRAVGHLLLAPYPWQWFDLRGSTGPFKALSAVESLLLYALLVPLVIGAGTVLRARSADGLYLLFFSASTGLLLALVVSNLGSLFRLRLEALLPLLTIVGPGLSAVRRWPNRRPTDAPAAISRA